MKTKRTIFLILGWLLIFLQFVGYFKSIARREPLIDQPGIPYAVGYNFMLIFGLMCLLVANKYKRKMQKQKELKELDELFKDFIENKKHFNVNHYPLHLLQCL